MAEPAAPTAAAEPIDIRISSPLRSDVLELHVAPKEPLNSVKQHLLALGPLVQPATSFVLEAEGHGELDLATPVGELPVKIMRIRLSPHTGASIAAQVESVREMLGFSEPQNALSTGATNLARVLNAAPAKFEASQLTSTEPAVFPSAEPNQPKRLAKQLEYSAWNPVRPAQKILGHLAYLRFVSFDSKVRHIVATSEGFAHAPQLTEDRWPSEWPSTGSFEHSLSDLLAKLSPATMQNVRRTAKQLKAQDPQAWLTVREVDAVVPWLVVPPKAPVAHEFTTGLQVTPEARDFNEDFQSTRELPKDTIGARASRDRMLVDVTSAFGAAAGQGARDIIDGTLVPLNPDEARDGHIFVRNGIFYTYGADYAGAFAALGGDEAARVAANKDLSGAEQLMQLDFDELCPVVTAVIDICGRRIVAQAPVPGVFRETGGTEVIYGSVEGSEDVMADKTIAPLFAKVAKALHLKPHTVRGVELETSVDTRGMRGTDNRLYALDLYRLAVPDVTFDTSKYPHQLVLHRVEAVLEYYRQNPEAPPLNPDAWTTDASADDKAELGKLGKFIHTLMETYVDAVVDNSTTYPIDGAQLTNTLHRRGINMRYLGALHALVSSKSLPVLSNLKQEIEYEAAARAAKHILNRRLATAELSEVAKIAADFFVSPPLAEIKDEAVRRFPGIKFEKVPFDARIVRSVSLKTGLQWTRADPTGSKDLANVDAVINFASPRSLLADEALEAGLATNDPNVIAESVAIYSQIYGPVHAEVARALNQAALAYHNIDNYPRAVELERRAVTVAERTMGIDNAETLVMYTNLSVFERAASNFSAAAELAKYVQSLWESVALPLHPEVASTYDSIGVLLQQTKSFAESIDWFERALAHLKSCGSSDLLAAPVHYKLSQSLLMAQKYPESTRHMERAYNAYKAAGDEELTKECKKWLDQLLHATVQAPKVLEAAKRHQLKPKAAEAPAKRASAPKEKKRSINDIVNYIMGDDKTSRAVKDKA